MFNSGFRINLTHIQRIIFRLHFPVSKNLRADPIFTSFATVSIPVKLYSLFANQLKVLELYCECWFSIGSSRWTNAHKWANVLLFRNYVLRSNCLIKPIALDIFRRFVFFFFFVTKHFIRVKTRTEILPYESKTEATPSLNQAHKCGSERLYEAGWNSYSEKCR